MIDTPQIVHTAAQSTAIIRLTVPRDQMRTVMGPGIDELMSTLRAQGIVPSGPWQSPALSSPQLDSCLFLALNLIAHVATLLSQNGSRSSTRGAASPEAARCSSHTGCEPAHALFRKDVFIDDRNGL